MSLWLPRLALRSRRFIAAGAHLLFSVLLAALCAFIVFRVWYPAPYDVLAGGLGLFLLMISVDVVIGSALTAIVASPSKPLPELKRDLAVIVAVQLAALGYGLWTIAEARPVYLAYEIDRFRVVTVADIEPSLLLEAPKELRTLPWAGPKTIAAVKPTDPQEQMRSLELGLAGIDLSMVPANWRPYADFASSAWQASRPLTPLLNRYPSLTPEVKRIAADCGLPVNELRFLPLMSKRASWVALLAPPNADPVGYLPVEGFF